MPGQYIFATGNPWQIPGFWSNSISTKIIVGFTDPPWYQRVIMVNMFSPYGELCNYIVEIPEHFFQRNKTRIGGFLGYKTGIAPYDLETAFCRNGVNDYQIIVLDGIINIFYMAVYMIVTVTPNAAIPGRLLKEIFKYPGAYYQNIFQRFIGFVKRSLRIRFNLSTVEAPGFSRMVRILNTITLIRNPGCRLPDMKKKSSVMLGINL